MDAINDDDTRSRMQRDLMQARFDRQLSQQQQEHDDDEELEELDSFPSSTSEIPLPTTARRYGKARGNLYAPLSASSHFDSALEIDLSSTRTLRVYYTPISFAEPAAVVIPSTTTPMPATAPWIKQHVDENDDEEDSNGVLFVCVHGAGYSGLSYAEFAQAVKKRNGRAGVLAYDSRGHGRSPASSEDGDPIDMSLSALSSDLVILLSKMFPDRSTAPKFLLIGHSMGGAVVVEACPRIQKEVGEVVGICVLDVVEGSALDALEGMNSFIEGQPKGFASVEQGIEWHIRTKTINNLASARLSVPPLLVDRGESHVPASTRFGWRVDLSKTEQYWKGWFTGLSSKFLSCRTAKLLILAGADRLDKELMIGQMQGKFQLEVYREVGHCLQEDAPARTASTLLEFWARNDRTDVLKGVKKVGQI